MACLILSNRTSEICVHEIGAHRQVPFLFRPLMTLSLHTVPNGFLVHCHLHYSSVFIVAFCVADSISRVYGYN